MSGSVLVIDQGTTSTRAMVFGPAAEPVVTMQEEFPQYYPQPGWVEQDPRDLWRTSVSMARAAIKRAADRGLTPAALAVTNQRETAILWDRKSGVPLHNAIGWQDRRTAPLCARLRASGHEAKVTGTTGLLLDPYFSATKIAWLLDTVPGARERAVRGDLAFGTVDTWLLWRLTNGAVYATDATNASRTALFDIHAGHWDEDLLDLFDIPKALLPDVRDCGATFGSSAPEHFGSAIPIRAVMGDQQAALLGQGCVRPGMAKSTFGTGCFILMNTGEQAVRSGQRLVTTLAWQLSGKRTYALEGSIFASGATLQWLRDGLLLLRSSAEAGQLAAEADAEQAVYLVPAFSGLGAPHWDAEARGTITGLTRGSTRREIARAALEAVAYQTRDLLAAMRADYGAGLDSGSALRVDGGVSGSDWTMQCVADMTGLSVERPVVRETTALGAAAVAGWEAGFYPHPNDVATRWALEREFTPAIDPETRRRKLKGWDDAVARTTLNP